MRSDRRRFPSRGYGENMEMGIQDHDRNLREFLDRCDQRNLHLNVDKIQLRVI